MQYAFLGGLIGFIIGSIAGAVMAPKRGARLLEKARSRFQKAKADADNAAGEAEKAVRRSFEEARRG